MLKRRSFLVAVLALLGAWPLSIFGNFREKRDKFQGLSTSLQDFFEDIDSAAFIGKRYLQVVPEKQSIVILVERILATVPEARGASLAVILCYRPGLVTGRHRQDFIEERVVRVDGWVLSATEARLCALCALI